MASLFHAATSGRLHHGWLISGPAGVGKATLAYRFARWLLAGGTTPDLSVPESNGVFRRIAATTHPDLFTVERRINEKTDRLQSEIVIAAVREAVKFMRLTPAEGGWRVVVVDGAENMNPNAANALLKMLEEPPPRAVLLLVSAAPSRLLPTIRSRCRALPLAALPDDVVAGLLGEYAPDMPAGERARLAGLAEGSVGAALALAQEGGVALAGLVDEILDGRVAADRAQAIADAVARTVEGVDKFETFWGLLRAGLAARTRSAARAGQGALAPRVALWEDFGKLGREVVGLSLDKRAAIVSAISAVQQGL